MDGTLVKAWASMKSVRPKDCAPPDRDDGPGDPPPPPAQETSADTDHQPPQTETRPVPDTPRQTRNAEVSFRGETRSNATHASITDPDARRRKTAPVSAAMPVFMRHTLTENRNGLPVQAELAQADGHGEREAALEMIERHLQGSMWRLTLVADKGHDSPRLRRRAPAHDRDTGALASRAVRYRALPTTGQPTEPAVAPPPRPTGSA